MEGTRSPNQPPQAPRHFREQSDGAPQADDQPRPGDEVEIRSIPLLEVHMTDEPGGDPYNHTGRFRRNFR